MHYSSDWEKNQYGTKTLVTSLVARQFVKPFENDPLLHDQSSSSTSVTETTDPVVGSKRTSVRFECSTNSAQLPAVTHPNGHSHMFLLRLYRILTENYHEPTIVVIFDASRLAFCQPFASIVKSFFSVSCFLLQFLSSECCRRNHKDHLLSTGC